MVTYDSVKSSYSISRWKTVANHWTTERPGHADEWHPATSLNHLDIPAPAIFLFLVDPNRARTLSIPFPSSPPLRRLRAEP